MELLVPLDGQAKMPLYEQIYRYVREEIRRGNLAAGTRLPSSRILAEHLKVSRSTVQMAYDQLLAEGYMETVPYKGCYVAQIEGILDVMLPGEGEMLARPGEEGGREKRAALSCSEREKSRRKAEKLKENGGEEDRGKRADHGAILVDFSPRGIDLENFPFGVWRRLNRDTLVDDNREMFAAGDPMGERVLRDTIRAYLHSARGVNCSADQILVGAGSEYLLMLLSRILGPDHRIAMENPAYKQAYRVLSGQGYPVCPLEMDRYGMRADLLEQCGADMAYVTPSHQYPMGIVMPVKRRRELLDWACGQEGRYLIEDDYDSEFRYRGMPIPALQGMDQEGRVIYMGTFSKSIAPAIRVGFLVLPEGLMEKYRKRASFYSCTVPRIDQNVLYQFLVKGHYERHLNRMRALYKGKHDTLLAGLRPLESRFRIQGEHAGLHILLTSRSGTPEGELISRAERNGVRVYGLSSCLIAPEQSRGSSTVILGYANLTTDKIREGARLLKEAWRDVEMC